VYLRLADEFLTDQRLSTQSPLPTVDHRLKPELDRLYLAGGALTLHSPSDKRLLCMTPLRYLQLVHLSRRLAHLAPANPHPLQHGGASADGLLTAGEQLSALEIASRGRWSSMKSIRRYRQPARYLRQLQRLSKSPLWMAKAVESKIPKLFQALLAARSKS
jgi:hypothetical protein